MRCLIQQGRIHFLRKYNCYIINSKKIFLVTGVCGQFGHDVVNNAIARGYEVVGSDIKPIYLGLADDSTVTSAPSCVQLDITDRESVLAAIEEILPDVIIHCAAWTAIDAAEDEENKATSQQAILTNEALSNIADTTLSNIREFFTADRCINEVCYKCGKLADCMQLHDKKCL